MQTEGLSEKEERSEGQEPQVRGKKINQRKNEKEGKVEKKE